MRWTEVMMGRMIKWLVAWVVMIGMAAPKVAYACVPSPRWWQATITEVELGAVVLPEGLAITTIPHGIEIQNSTDKPVLIGKTATSPVHTIEANATLSLTEIDLYDAFFPDEYGNYGNHMGEDKPQLPDERPLILHHKGQRYEIPARLTYHLEYHPDDGGGSCGMTYLFQALSAICPFVLFSGAVIWLIVAFIRNQRAAG